MRLATGLRKPIAVRTGKSGAGGPIALRSRARAARRRRSGARGRRAGRMESPGRCREKVDLANYAYLGICSGFRHGEVRRMQHAVCIAVLDAKRTMIEMRIMVGKRSFLGRCLVRCVLRADRCCERRFVLENHCGRNGRQKCSEQNRKTCDPCSAAVLPFMHFYRLSGLSCLQNNVWTTRRLMIQIKIFQAP